MLENLRNLRIASILALAVFEIEFRLSNSPAISTSPRHYQLEVRIFPIHKILRYRLFHRFVRFPCIRRQVNSPRARIFGGYCITVSFAEAPRTLHEATCRPKTGQARYSVSLRRCVDCSVLVPSATYARPLPLHEGKLASSLFRHVHRRRDPESLVRKLRRM
jgi:hypothetical protein